MDDVHEVKLSNGLRVLLYRRGIAPVFAGVLTVRVGGSDEGPGTSGISHMLEHMAFKGTPEIGSSDYARERVLLDELEEIVARGEGNRVVRAEDRARWDNGWGGVTAPLPDVPLVDRDGPDQTDIPFCYPRAEGFSTYPTFPCRQS